MSLDIRILELYGMSESTGMHTSQVSIKVLYEQKLQAEFQLTEKFKSKSCGITPEGVTSKLVPVSLNLIINHGEI